MSEPKPPPPAAWGLARLSLTARLMIISGLVLVLGGGAVLTALTLRDVAEVQPTLEARAREELQLLAPLVLEQAVRGDVASIRQLLVARTRATSIRAIEWVDGRIPSTGRSQHLGVKESPLGRADRNPPDLPPRPDADSSELSLLHDGGGD